MAGRPYRVYTDACDYGLAGILQQVQPIHIRDLKGTRTYERLVKAYRNKEAVPVLVPAIKGVNDVPEPTDWADDFDDTIVHVERVICYWSRVLKSPERNYSPTERKALALKEALIKFQTFLEGEEILAITDHAALTWSRTFQNVNRRLLTWGTVFSAYPNLHIVHRAGRVHSNVDPISRLRRRLPQQDGPPSDQTAALELGNGEDPLRNMFEDLGQHFEEKLLTVAAKYAITSYKVEDSSKTIGEVELDFEDATVIRLPYTSSQNYTVLIGISPGKIKDWASAYEKDPHFTRVLKDWKGEKNWVNPTFPQYHYSDSGLIYFEDWQGNNRLCVPESY